MSLTIISSVPFLYFFSGLMPMAGLGAAFIFVSLEKIIGEEKLQIDICHF